VLSGTNLTAGMTVRPLLSSEISELLRVYVDKFITKSDKLDRFTRFRWGVI